LDILVGLLRREISS